MTALRVDHRSAELRRAVGPVAWFVLEELLLGDGEPGGATFVARASARSLSKAVSLNKDTVARALAVLAAAGVVEPLRQTSDGGRFAAGGYRVLAPIGITRFDEPSAPDERPRRAHRRAPEPTHGLTQLTLIDVAAIDAAAHSRTAHPEPSKPPDALAPPVSRRPASRGGIQT
jgi:hypothetical protein